MYMFKVIEISSTHSCTSLLQVPMVRYAKKNLYFLLYIIEMAILSGFWWKKGLWILGVKYPRIVFFILDQCDKQNINRMIFQFEKNEWVWSYLNLHPLFLDFWINVTIIWNYENFSRFVK